MSSHLFAVKKSAPQTAARLVELYLYAARHYPPQIAKQYAVHRAEAERQSGRGKFPSVIHPPPRMYRRDTYNLPRRGKERCWERPYDPTAGPRDRHFNPATFDRCVGLHRDHEGVRKQLVAELRKLAPARKFRDFVPFIAACRAAPEDDAPFLIACDWLEERGVDCSAVRELLYLRAE